MLGPNRYNWEFGEENTLKFGIHRKPVATDRYITSDSNQNRSQKQAAIHSMVHRLCNIPMENKELKEKRKVVHEYAQLNGYDKEIVSQSLLRKHERNNR